mmetsp:Transcript_129760/g.403570  ORF Transcript_129760/g.403570 Transcript_129760/m.403570 type:complete len:288 (-) Transcript_129760:15-878(-)
MVGAAVALHVSSLGGQLCVVEASRFWTAREVQERIERKTGIPAQEQRLFHGSSEVTSEDPLHSLPPGDTLELALVRSRCRVEWAARAAEDRWALEDAPRWVRADRAVVLAAVRQHGSALEFAAEALRADHEVVLAAIHQDACALEFAVAELWHDRAFVRSAVSQNGLLLISAVEELRADEEIVVAAALQNRASLRWAADELKRDRGFLLRVLGLDLGQGIWSPNPVRAPDPRPRRAATAFRAGRPAVRPRGRAGGSASERRCAGLCQPRTAAGPRDADRRRPERIET